MPTNPEIQGRLWRAELATWNANQARARRAYAKQSEGRPSPKSGKCLGCGRRTTAAASVCRRCRTAARAT